MCRLIVRCRERVWLTVDEQVGNVATTVTPPSSHLQSGLMYSSDVQANKRRENRESSTHRPPPAYNPFMSVPLPMPNQKQPQDRTRQNVTRILNSEQAQMQNAPDTVERAYPLDFECPITLDIMHNPVVASDGHSYEKTALVSWFAAGNTRSPKTNDEMDTSLMLPNHSLRNLIQAWQESGASWHE